MIFKKNIFFTLLAVLLVAMACNQNTAETVEPEAVAPAKKSNIYQPSELAQLMRDLHAASADWKTEIETGGEITPIPEWAKNIKSAEATDPNDLNDTFFAMATAYLASLNDFENADKESVKKYFNNTITNCVNCHQVFCQGPIPKIKKLYLD